MRARATTLGMPMFRAVMLGSAGVGKSNLALQLCDKSFFEEYTPMAPDNFFRKPMVVDGEEFMLQILDHGRGDDELDEGRDQLNFIRWADSFLLVYAIDNRASFLKIPELHDAIVRTRDTFDGRKIPLVLVATKSDLEMTRVCSAQEGLELAWVFECPYIEVSAKFNTNIEEAFNLLAKEIKTAEKFQPKPEKKTSKCTLL